MDAHELRHNWGWILAIGCIAILAGLIAITYSVLATIVSVLVLSWLLIFAGVLEAVYAIRHRDRGHMTLYLLEALLSIVIGALLLQSPARGAIVGRGADHAGDPGRSLVALCLL